MAKVNGKGTTVEVSISGTFTAIAQIVSVTPPALKQQATIDTTSITDNDVRRQANKVRDWQNVKVKLQWDPANTGHQYLMTSARAGTTESWTVKWTDADTTEAAFSGFLDSFPFGELTNNVVQTIDFEIAVDGDVTIS